MRTIFDNGDEDHTGSIALCYEIFGEEAARKIAAKVPRAEVEKRDDDDEPRNDIYIA